MYKVQELQGNIMPTWVDVSTDCTLEQALKIKELYKVARIVDNYNKVYKAQKESNRIQSKTRNEFTELHTKLNKMNIARLKQMNPKLSKHDIYTILECCINAKVLQDNKEFFNAYKTVAYVRKPVEYCRLLEDINQLIK